MSSITPWLLFVHLNILYPNIKCTSANDIVITTQKKMTWTAHNLIVKLPWQPRIPASFQHLWQWYKCKLFERHCRHRTIPSSCAGIREERRWSGRTWCVFALWTYDIGIVDTVLWGVVGRDPAREGTVDALRDCMVPIWQKSV